MAMHVASKIGRPVVMIHGDEEFSTSDLVGGEHGYRMRKVVDNFIHSVLKTEENMQKSWVDNRLTIACKYGSPLFTMSSPVPDPKPTMCFCQFFRRRCSTCRRRVRETPTTCG